MKTTTDSIIARYIATRAIPSWGNGAPRIHVDAKAYTLDGNQHPYFSVTATIDDQWTRRHGDIRAGGCLHDEILRLWPQLAPIVALHLSDALTGEPMHAEANGWYWMAGALGGAGEEYHGGNSNPAKSPDECLAILAKHLRISAEEAARLLINTRAYAEPRKFFSAFVAAQRPRWQAEAQAGRSASRPKRKQAEAQAGRSASRHRALARADRQAGAKARRARSPSNGRRLNTPFPLDRK